jgi:outer membrane protein OmpU
MNAVIPLVCLALAAASPAYAEMTISGEAKMGLSFDGQDTEVRSGVRLTTHFSGVTDGGLEYGAIINLQTTSSGAVCFEEGAGCGNPAFGFNDDSRPGAQVYIGTANQRLTVGAVDDAVGSLRRSGN